MCRQVGGGESGVECGAGSGDRHYGHNSTNVAVELPINVFEMHAKFGRVMTTVRVSARVHVVFWGGGQVSV